MTSSATSESRPRDVTVVVMLVTNGVFSLAVSMGAFHSYVCRRRRSRATSLSWIWGKVGKVSHGLARTRKWNTEHCQQLRLWSSGVMATQTPAEGGNHNTEISEWCHPSDDFPMVGTPCWGGAPYPLVTAQWWPRLFWIVPPPTHLCSTFLVECEHNAFPSVHRQEVRPTDQ